MSSISYKDAGVDVAAGNEAVARIKGMVESTFTPQVLSGIGGFGSLYDLRWICDNYRHPVLVQSIDGVGTKMMVAKRMQTFDTIGIDLVSATSNDIIVLGAKPLTLLDYIANDKLNPVVIEQIIKGMVQACIENGIALVGGETAEMPGTYLPGEFDLAGIVSGVVEKDKAIMGRDIVPGDIVAAFPSSGLHTNGYSLARKLFFDVGGYDVDSRISDFTLSIGEELLAPHINYTLPILAILEKNIPVKGMAHITGGGLRENIPRILPAHCAVELVKSQIPELPVFQVLRQLGKLNDDELYRTFNMGAGMVLFLAPDTLAPIREVLRDFPQFPLYEIGQVVAGKREVRLL